MNIYDKLKLDVYESGLDFEDCKEIVDIMESCTDEEAEEVVEAVLNLVEESRTDVRNAYDKAYNVHPEKADAALIANAIGTSMAYGEAISATGSAESYAIYKIKLKKLKKDLKNCTSKLSKEHAPSKQKALESRIDKIQNDIRKCEEKMKKAKKTGISGAKLAGAGAATKIASEKYLGHLSKSSSSKKSDPYKESADSLAEIIEIIDSI